ncbi:MAG: hypothetical protein HC923_01840 [Myxococcales bacterium]|nr:hypothetical protein [Myxococcales bacterium]
MLLLPMVAAGRLLPRSWRRSWQLSGSRDGSIFVETSAEVHNVLAFVFMA